MNVCIRAISIGVPYSLAQAFAIEVPGLIISNTSPLRRGHSRVGDFSAAAPDASILKF